MPDSRLQTTRWREIFLPALSWGLAGGAVIGATARAAQAFPGLATSWGPQLFVTLLGALAGLLYGSRRTALRRLQERLAESEKRLLAIQRITPAQLQALDADGRLIYVNQLWLDTLGYRRDQVIGRPFSEFVIAEEPAGTQGDLRASGEVRTTRCRLRRGDGQELEVELHEDLEPGEGGAAGRRFAMLTVPAWQQAAAERLDKLIYHDSLTGLPSRHLLNDRLRHAIIQARRENNQVGVFYFDLDHFKVINDTQGHAAGDEVLRSVAQRLKKFIREGDTFARIGGDEFVIVQADPNHDPNFAILGRRITEALGEPFRVGTCEFYSTASIGIAIYPRDGDTPQALLQNADTAMYAAKNRGRNNFQFFSSEMNEQAQFRADLATGLRVALDNQELTLHYQPQVDLASGRVVAVEALLRWQTADGKMIAPSEIVSVAEESGLIFPLDEWILEAACRQASVWKQAGLPPLRMAVNLSGHHIRQANFVDRLERICQATGMNVANLEIELTETSVMGHVQEIIMTLTDLKVRGVGLAIDDFGTGYSSLLYLKHFPVQRVKIAREFILGIDRNSDYTMITDAIICMARSLELAVTAIGVENATQLEFLRDHGCTEAAGFFLSPPLSADAITRLLSGNGNLLEQPAAPAKA